MSKKKFVYNSEKLIYEPNKEKFFKTKRTLIILSLLLSGYILGHLVGSTKNNRYNENGDIILKTKHDYIIGSKPWLDSTLRIYKESADLYLSRPEFKGTPITGEILALACANAYDSTGILLPVELALAQAQWESGMGLKGKSPKNNPYNIGETDNGTVIWFNSTFEGVQSYYYWMCLSYLKCSSLDQLFNSFTNCSGNRYAWQPSYEVTIRDQYYYIKEWISEQR